MSRLKLRFSVFALLLLVMPACSKGGSDDNPNQKESARAGNKVAVEAPAPLQPAGKTFVYNFDREAVGQMPAKFHEAMTGQGAQAQWVVEADPSAPSQPNVLAQLSSDKTDYRIPLAIADEGSFLDLDLSVRFKAVSGNIDRAAGLVFRFKDATNYYIVRANALEGNYTLYHVVAGKRQQFAGANFKVASDEWHELRVECVGNKITCYYDGEMKIESTDDYSKKLARSACGPKPIRLLTLMTCG